RLPAPLRALPDVATSAEQGLPEFQAVGWNAMFAPKGTSKEIIDRLNVVARGAQGRQPPQAATGACGRAPSRIRSNARGARRVREQGDRQVGANHQGGRGRGPVAVEAFADAALRRQ